MHFVALCSLDLLQHSATTGMLLLRYYRTVVVSCDTAILFSHNRNVMATPDDVCSITHCQPGLSSTRGRMVLFRPKKTQNMYCMINSKIHYSTLLLHRTKVTGDFLQCSLIQIL